MGQGKYKLIVTEKGSLLEWVLLVPYVILTVLIGRLGISVNLLEYSARYYDTPKVSYGSSYMYLMVGVTLLYFVYAFLDIYIKGRIFKKTVRMTIDMVLVAAFFFGVQLAIFHFMNVRLGL